jgi:hypothetical protein
MKPISMAAWSSTEGVSRNAVRTPPNAPSRVRRPVAGAAGMPDGRFADGAVDESQAHPGYQLVLGIEFVIRLLVVAWKMRRKSRPRNVESVEKRGDSQIPSDEECDVNYPLPAECGFGLLVQGGIDGVLRRQFESIRLSKFLFFT